MPKKSCDQWSDQQEQHRDPMAFNCKKPLDKEHQFRRQQRRIQHCSHKDFTDQIAYFIQTMAFKWLFTPIRIRVNFSFIRIYLVKQAFSFRSLISAVNVMSLFSKSSFTNSLLGSIPFFIKSTRSWLISNPTTFIFFANSRAIGNPTYPSPMTAILPRLPLVGCHARIGKGWSPSPMPSPLSGVAISCPRCHARSGRGDQLS